MNMDLLLRYTYIYNLLHLISELSPKASTLGLFKHNKIMSSDIQDGVVRLHIWREIT